MENNTYDVIKKVMYFVTIGEDEFDSMFTEEDPHIKHGDLYMVPHVKVTDKNGLMSFAITKPLLDEYGVSKEQVIKDALVSCERVMPRRIDTMRNMLGGLIPFSNPGEAGNLTVVTNEKGPYGASTLFYSGVLEDVSKRMGGDYYVLPSSKHEVICLPVEGQDVEVLKLMVYGINHAEVDEVDRLSDNVYLYSAATREFSVA